MDTGNLENKPVAIAALTSKGAELGRRLKNWLPGSSLFLPEKFFRSQEPGEYCFSTSLKELVAEVFGGYKYLVLIMATGIAVRMIAPLLKNKHTDPGVVVVDDGGQFAISLLSGHVGGANELARRVADGLGGIPVITTASDVAGAIPVDILGKEYGWAIENRSHLNEVSMAMVEGEPVGIFQESGETSWRDSFVPFPRNVTIYASLEALTEARPRAALIISDRVLTQSDLSLLPETTIVYRPKSLVVGIGCNRSTSSEIIQEAIRGVLSEQGLAYQSVKKLATIDIKKDEAGLLEYARKQNFTIDFFSKEALYRAQVPSPPSGMVMKHVGVPAVCEAAAALSAGGPLIAAKKSYRRAVTVAVARLAFEPEKPVHRGKLYVVGTGPGDLSQLTLRARRVIAQSEIIVGYETYVNLIKPLLGQKEILYTGMGAEVKRVKAALELARQGYTVSIVSGGDSGVYGMAGLVGEILQKNGDTSLEMEVVPGIPALAAAASLLGAPLMTDFACISLSDHLVSWEEIQGRLESAARANFVIVLYNPKSKMRPALLGKAREIVLRFRAPSTVVGVVTRAYREGRRLLLLTWGTYWKLKSI